MTERAEAKSHGDVAVEPTKAYRSGLILFFALATIVPLLVWNRGPAPVESMGAGPLVVLALAAARLGTIFARPQHRPYEMVTLVFTYVFLGIAPLIQLQSWTWPETTPRIERQYIGEATLGAIVGFVFLLAGLSWGRPPATPRPTSTSPACSPRRLWTFCLLAWFTSAALVLQVGISSFWSSREVFSRSTSLAIADPLVRVMWLAASTILLLVAFLQVHHRLQVTTVESRLGWRVARAVTAALLLVTVNPLSSPRYVFGTVVLAVLHGTGVFHSLRGFRTATLGLLAGLMLVYPYLDAYRYSSAGSPVNVSPIESFSSADFDVFAQLTNTVSYVDQYGVQPSQAVGVLSFWVPRSLWEGKPVDTGTLLAEHRGYDFTNLSASLWSELFINASWPGLCVGMAVFGYLIRRADMKAHSIMALRRLPSVSHSILPWYLIIVLRGSLLQAMAYLGLITLALLYFRERGSTAGSVSRPRVAAVAGGVQFVRH